MDIVVSEPFRAASAVWVTPNGGWSLTLVCKVTFMLTPNVTTLADVPIPPLANDVYLNGDPKKELYGAGDLVPSKALTDVVLVGRAYAPGGAPMRSLTVRLAVGDIDKRFEVFCDRVFWQGQVLEGQPFSSMPLAYERAAGGPNTTNPVGISFDAPPDAHGSVAIANLQPVGASVVRPGDRFAAVGYGPISPSWPERVAKLGRLAGSFQLQAHRTQPLPRELNDAFFNCAPRDQQIRGLRGDEPLVLENLNPTVPHLVTRLPGVSPQVTWVAAGTSTEENIAMNAATLHLDTERGLGTLTWLGKKNLRHNTDTGKIVVTERLRHRTSQVPSAPTAAPIPRIFGANTGEDTGTVVAPADGGRASTLPFENPAAQDGRTAAPSIPRGPALPFSAPYSPWVQPAISQSDRILPLDPEDTGTLAGSVRSAESALPFGVSPKPTFPVAEAIQQQLSPTPLAVVIPPEPQPPPPALSEPPALLTEEPELLETKAPTSSPLARYTVAKCGQITASIARRRSERAAILSSHDLDEATWAEVSAHWNSAIQAGLQRGDTKLLDAFDDGYVTQLEAERGEVTVPDYARLLLADERGHMSVALTELGLPRGAMLRLERVWGRRIGEDPNLDEDIDRALDELRNA